MIFKWDFDKKEFVYGKELNNDEKQWELSDKVIEKYHPFDVVNYRTMWINPRKILGLCWPVEKVKNDSKMKRLRDSVYANGWLDKLPMDLHLYYLPDKNFTVASGGDHRSYLSNELKLPKIQASVTIVLPYKIIPDEVKNLVEYYRFKESIYETEARNIREQIREKGILELDSPEEKDFDHYCDLQDDMGEKWSNCLLSFAKTIGMIPVEEV